MSLLSHMILGGYVSGEPAATRALGYILSSSPDMARTFVRLVGPPGVEFEPGRIEAETTRVEVRPDITIEDDTGRVRLFVENKFWAGLTEAQPVEYLEALPPEVSAGLVFIAPEARLASLWRELARRCREADIELAGGRDGTEVRWGRSGSRTLLATSWRHTIDVLLAAESAHRDPATRGDVLQLRGFTDRMDREGFLPLQAGELTDQSLARRLVNYSELVLSIAERLIASGIADAKGLRPSHNYYRTGRYLLLGGRFEIWLGIHLQRWSDHGVSPLWVEMYMPQDSAGNTRDPREVARLLDVDETWIDGGAKAIGIPIGLAIGIERDGVIAGAAGEVAKLAEGLAEVFPEGVSEPYRPKDAPDD